MSGGASSNKGGEASIRNDDVLRIVLVGKTGAGKSATGNTILSSEAFESRASPESVTSSCEQASSVVNGRQVSVVDTPGLFETLCSEDENLKEISECIKLAAPGPHAFLVVIKLDSRFTDEEQRSVEMILKLFGLKSNDYTMIVFTNSDRLEGQTVEVFLKESQKLQAFVNKCKGGYHVFNNKTKDPSQVNELLEKINNMVLKNGGSHYTNEMFKEVARKIVEEKERQRRAEREEKERERREIEKKMLAELEEKMREENKEMVKVVKVITATTTTTGTIIGGAIGGAEIGALSGSVAGTVGAVVGAVVGLGIGAGFVLIQQYKNRNTSEDKKPLIKNEQSTESE